MANQSQNRNLLSTIAPRRSETYALWGCWQFLTALAVAAAWVTTAAAQEAPTVAVGDRVEFEFMGEMVQGEVTRIVNNHMCHITFTWKDRERNTLKTVDQVQRVAALPRGEVRTWQDNTGKFSVTASLLEDGPDEVTLQLEGGETIKVPRTRLSQEDLTYLAELKKSNDSNNPFAVPATKPANSGEMPPETLETNWPLQPIDLASALPLRTDLVETWTPLEVPPAERFAGAATQFSLAKTDKVDYSKFIVAPRGNVGVLAVSKPFENLNTSPFVVLDLQRGAVTHQLQIPKADCQILDISPDGKHVIASHGPIGRPSDRSLTLWRIGSDAVEYVAGWQAPERSAAAPDLFWKGQFINDNTVVLYQPTMGSFYLFDLEKQEPKWSAAALHNSLPWISASGDRMLLVTAQGLLQIDPLAGSVVGIAPLAGGEGGGLAVSPDGRQLALVSATSCRIFDLASGECLDEFASPLKGPIEGVDWIADQTLLVHSFGNQLAQIDLRLKCLAWQYHLPRGKIGSRFAGLCWAVVEDRGVWGVLALSLPGATARQTLARLQLADMVALGPDSTISLEFQTPFTPEENNAIRAHLTDSLGTHGIRIAAQPQAVVLRVAVRLGEVEKVDYHTIGRLGGSETVTVQPRIHILELVENGRVVWSWTQTRGGAAPMIMSESGDETLQQTMDRIAQPDAKIFLNAHLPRYITRFPQGQSPGHSAISLQGVN